MADPDFFCYFSQILKPARKSGSNVGLAGRQPENVAQFFNRKPLSAVALIDDFDTRERTEDFRGRKGFENW